MNAKIISRMAMLAWTAVVAYLVFEVSRWPDSPPSHSAYADFAPDLDAAVRNLAIIVLLFVAWPLGLTLIRGVARGCVALKQWHREAPERRRYRAALKARPTCPAEQIRAAWWTPRPTMQRITRDTSGEKPGCPRRDLRASARTVAR